MAAHRMILHYGNDALLTEARIRVLEDAGYEVVKADTANAAFRALRTCAVDLVLVCHSVGAEELEAAVAEMKRLKGHVPVLVIHVGGLVRPQRARADGFIDGLRGPEHLLAQVANFVAQTDSTAAAS